MFKMLLASTALTALVTTTALAASHAEATDANAATDAKVETEMMEAKASASGDGSLASDLIGSAVYGSSDENADMIGDINDLVITPEGKVASVIVGVGGFLGIGEKDVAVEYDTIEWVDRNGERWLVANMTREQLEAAEAFDRSTVYTEARSEDDGVEATEQMAENTAATAEQTAAEETAERVEEGESAVAMAEEKVTTIDRGALTAVMSNELSAERLLGQTVYGSNDENIGEIGDVLLGSDNKVEGFVVDVGGFLGIGEKEVAISPEKLDIRANENGEIMVFTPFTQEQLESQKAYTKEDWQADRDGVILIVPEG